MAGNYTKSLYKDYEKLSDKYDKLSEEIKLYRNEHILLEQETRLNNKLKHELEEKKAENAALKREILRLNGLLNTDSSNSGTPTSKTPINKKKRIPNSRKKTEKHIGGQKGHPKSKLEKFKENEITENIEHSVGRCPECGGKMKQMDEEIIKDETDYEVVVVKKRHHFHSYECMECGAVYRQAVPHDLKEENQYGSGVKSLALLLMDMGNVSVNKACRMMEGLSQQEIHPSEGYIIKQQKKAAKALECFEKELLNEITRQEILYWDDTVIMISTARGCLRFYGTENLALYKAHLHKDKEGIDSDGILPVLPVETVVMHDHNKVNYNETYSFSNIECNAHLLRDLQKIKDNLPDHAWAGEMKDFINNIYKEREQAITEGYESFTEEKEESIFRKLNQLLLKGIGNNKNNDSYYDNEERKLLNRIAKYKSNYFAWVTNFELPFTNNLSERSLRGTKSKMKISGQFQSLEYAGYYASVKSYIETCYRNGIDEYTALRRLCDGSPYTVAEILGKNE